MTSAESAGGRDVTNGHDSALLPWDLPLLSFSEAVLACRHLSAGRRLRLYAADLPDKASRQTGPMSQPRPARTCGHLLLHVKQRPSFVLHEVEAIDGERDALFDVERRARKPAIHGQHSILISTSGWEETDFQG